jgi:hypothetical protein
MRKLVVLLACLTAWGASASSATTQQKMFGVMDDNPVMGLAAQAGFNLVKKTVWISPTQWHWNSMDSKFRSRLTQDMSDAQAAGESVILELYPVIKYGPPRGPSQQRNTCMLAKDLLDQFPQTYGIEIGVEPNSYTFWKPQFYPDGTQASAGQYERWLATCYDILKASHPDTLVIGGSLSSRGDDNPHKLTSGTSPTLFIQKFCDALVATGRTKPVMDVLDMHSYPDPEDQDPSVQHPAPSTTITIADSAKLDGLLNCFSKAGSLKPPYLWGEGGYNTAIPVSQKQYIGQKPASVRVVDESTQGRYIAEEIRMAYCQPNSVGFINFHMIDDANLSKDWQSGLAYALGHGQRGTSSGYLNYSHKQSWQPVKDALTAVNNGSMSCG